MPAIRHRINHLGDKIQNVRVRPRYYIVCDDGTFARLAVASFYRIVRQDAGALAAELGMNLRAVTTRPR